MSALPVSAVRGTRIDEIAEALPTRSAMLARLFLAQSSVPVSRTEAGVLRRLMAGSCRVTELAAHESVTQPAITLLVKRMEERGWVSRASDPLDGRAVLVALTPAGRRAWTRLVGEYRALLHEEMGSLDDGDVEVLARAVEILDHLIDRLRLAGQPARFEAEGR
jgi:DNA-binding MarR family transcriptional regulator